MQTFREWMNEKEGKETYKDFFNKKLEKYGVKSASELTGEDKKKFFDEVDAEWEGENEEPEAGDVNESDNIFIKEEEEANKKIVNSIIENMNDEISRLFRQTNMKIRRMNNNKDLTKILEDFGKEIKLFDEKITKIIAPR